MAVMQVLSAAVLQERRSAYAAVFPIWSEVCFGMGERVPDFWRESSDLVTLFFSVYCFLLRPIESYFFFLFLTERGLVVMGVPGVPGGGIRFSSQSR